MLNSINNNNEQSADSLDLIGYWNLLWSNKYSLAAFVLVAMLVTMVVSFLSPKIYRSEAVIIAVSSDSGGLGSALVAQTAIAGLLSGSSAVLSSDNRISLILRSRSIAEAIIKRFDLMKVFNREDWDSSKEMWKDPSKPPLMVDTVRTLSDITKINKMKDGGISIRVEWTDAKLAAEIANYYVYALTEFLKDRSMNTTIQVVDRAIPAEKKAKPYVRLNVMIAGAVSTCIGIFFLVVLDYVRKAKEHR